MRGGVGVVRGGSGGCVGVGVVRGGGCEGWEWGL